MFISLGADKNELLDMAQLLQHRKYRQNIHHRWTIVPKLWYTVRFEILLSNLNFPILYNFFMNCVRRQWTRGRQEILFEQRNARKDTKKFHGSNFFCANVSCLPWNFFVSISVFSCKKSPYHPVLLLTHYRDAYAGEPPAQLRKADLGTQEFRQCRFIRQSDNPTNFPRFPCFPWTKNKLWASARLTSSL